MAGDQGWNAVRLLFTHACRRHRGYLVVPRHPGYVRADGCESAGPTRRFRGNRSHGSSPPDRRSRSAPFVGIAGRMC